MSIDRSGEFVIKPVYAKVEPFSEGLSCVYKSYPHFGYIDKRGKVVIPLEFKGAGSLSEGRAVVYVGDGTEYSKKFKYIDSAGKFPSKKSYFYAHAFKNGLAKAERVNFWANMFLDIGILPGLMRETAYYIDKKQKVVWKARTKF